jgi:YidC/Oxa1 family membrane protein insertase
MKDYNKVIGVIFLCAALGLMAWQSKTQAARMEAWKTTHPESELKTSTQEVPAESAPERIVTAPAPVQSLGQENFVELENALIKLTFTTRGGALHAVAFKKYPSALGSQKPFVWESAETLPALALSLADGSQADLADYTLLSHDATSIVFQRDEGNGLALERRYELTLPEKRQSAEGYLLKQTLTWRNRTGTALALPDFGLGLGVPTPEAGDPSNLHLNFGAYNGHEGKFVTPAVFKGSHFIFWSSPAKSRYDVEGLTAWACVKNQFFVNVTTPEAPATGAWAIPAQTLSPDGKELETLGGGLRLKGLTVPAGGMASFKLVSYLGPMEYARLASLDGKQDEVMQWGWPIFSFFAKLFISLLNTLARAVHNYGAAIVVLTFVIRFALWPLTDGAARASKEMARVQPLLKELQTKYKDNPERQQRETLKLFQEHHVNPMAGCLPSLLQIPVFLGFFYMLRSAAELRFEPFLWIKDLSMPDTVATLGGFPLNPLPVVMTLTMFVQMKLTPTSGDPDSQKIMMLTPFIFAFMLYNFSAGLTLYWTLSNLISIFQQLRINAQKDDPTPISGAGKNDGKTIDVIPSKA